MGVEELTRIIEEINNFTPIELFSHELILSSQYYHLSVVCLDIKTITVKDELNVLELVMTNNKVYQFQYSDVDLCAEINVRDDVNIIEEDIRRKKR